MKDASNDPVDACIRGYDEWAKTYDTIDNPLIAQAAVVLDARRGWCERARVLELGCGTGRNARWALDAGAAAYVGIDASEGMLAVARAAVADARASFIRADLIDGAQRASGFDVVLICLVLEHVAEVAPVLRAAAAALRPGGRLLILELHPDLHARGIGANFRVGDTEHRLPSHRHTAAELEAAIGAAGLRGLQVIDHAPSAAALARSRKLARFVDSPVLLEVQAERG